MAKMVKVVLLKNVSSLGMTGQTVEVTEQVAETLTTPRKHHDGSKEVMYRTARLFDEAQDSPNLNAISVSQAREMGLKNTVEAPAKLNKPSAAAASLNAQPASEKKSPGDKNKKLNGTTKKSAKTKDAEEHPAS